MAADAKPERTTGRMKPPAPSPVAATSLHLGGEVSTSFTLGEYRVVRLLGEGAMGKVYEAVQASLGRTVALKVLPEAFARSADAVERFEREARSAADLKHPNIVPVYQFGREGDLHWYAMELVDGRSLRDLLKDPRKPLEDQKKVAKYVLNAALALDYAHGRGVIHRDVKPDNILVRSKDDQVILTDFGLARLEDRRAITQAGALMGTPVYMAPEQALGKEIDRRVDVWALGVTLHELLGGKLPFFSERLRDLLVQITQEPPASLREQRPDVSPDLEAIALKCMAKERDERYPTAKAVADDLIRFFRGELVSSRSMGRVERLLRTARKNRAVTALAALLVVGVTATLVGTRVLARARATHQAREALDAAQALVAGPLRAHAAAAERLAAARAARDRARPGAKPAERRQQRAAAAEDAARALEGLRAAEQGLLDRTADADAAASRALVHLRAALLVAPDGHPLRAEAEALGEQLVLALRGRARRAGDAELVAAADRERTTLGRATGAAGPCGLAVITDPPGARAALHAVRQDARGWTLGEPDGLGTTPLGGIEVAPGEYVLVLEAEGRTPARVPLRVDEDDRTLDVALELAAAGAAPPGFVWIAPGECGVGGDPRAVRSLSAERLPAWTDGFFLAEVETTVAEWVAFLNALPAAERAAHLASPVQLDAGGAAVAARPGAAEQAVTGVRLESARAYARWRSAREPTRRYRLPTDVEWEKAARGPAGRAFPWGDGFDPEARPPLSNLHLGEDQGRPRLSAPRAFPWDRSIWNVFDLAGNVSEWVEGGFPGNARFGVLRGGSWDRGAEVVRLASREPIDPADTADLLRVRDRVGFRLALDVVE